MRRWTRRDERNLESVTAGDGCERLVATGLCNGWTLTCFRPEGAWPAGADGARTLIKAVPASGGGGRAAARTETPRGSWLLGHP